MAGRFYEDHGGAFNAAFGALNGMALGAATGFLSALYQFTPATYAPKPNLPMVVKYMGRHMRFFGAVCFAYPFAEGLTAGLLNTSYGSKTTIGGSAGVGTVALLYTRSPVAFVVVTAGLSTALITSDYANKESLLRKEQIHLNK